MNWKPSVLFLDTHNSDRSQMAEGLLRHLAGDRFEVMSAGVLPREVHPLTGRVLEEVGIAETLVAKGVETYLARTLVHYAIILQDASPLSPRIYPFATQVLRWPIADPLTPSGSDEKLLERFRRARDEIRSCLESWLGEMELTRVGLEPAAPGSSHPSSTGSLTS